MTTYICPNRLTDCRSRGILRAIFTFNSPEFAVGALEYETELILRHKFSIRAAWVRLCGGELT